MTIENQPFEDVSPIKNGAFLASHVGEIAGIETESKWKSIEHHELHHPTNGMFAQAGGWWKDGVTGVILVG